jgi:hypothetical protein
LALLKVKKSPRPTGILYLPVLKTKFVYLLDSVHESQ